MFWFLWFDHMLCGLNCIKFKEDFWINELYSRKNQRCYSFLLLKGQIKRLMLFLRDRPFWWNFEWNFGTIFIMVYNIRNLFQILFVEFAAFDLISFSYLTKFTNGFSWWRIEIFFYIGGICRFAYKNTVHTITSDNGSEFAEHELIAEKLKADFYFAHPYSSWERGLNEYTNKLIRQYILKGSNFDLYDGEFIKLVQNKINRRPREKLNFQTPSKIFYASLNWFVAFVTWIYVHTFC